MAHSGIPQYRQIASELMSGIISGRPGIGEEMPTEGRISATYGVSRSTAREALRVLKDRGLITRQRGTASRVVAATPAYRYTMTLASEIELLRYVGMTALELHTRNQPVSPQTLRQLGQRDNEKWLRSTGLRWAQPDDQPIAALNIYVKERFADVLASLDGPLTGAVFSRILERHGLSLSSLDQTITAISLGADSAKALAEEPGSAALQIVRRFSADGVGPFQISVSVHPGDRFAYTMRLDTTEPALDE
jgi:GntR family transcriptional regulator